jgi:hypothetical protein
MKHHFPEPDIKCEIFVGESIPDVLRAAADWMDEKGDVIVINNICLGYLEGAYIDVYYKFVKDNV